jgi:hypothetical protein
LREFKRVDPDQAKKTALIPERPNPAKPEPQKDQSRNHEKRLIQFSCFRDEGHLFIKCKESTSHILAGPNLPGATYRK